MLNAAILAQFLQRLDAEAESNSAGGEWVFANGESYFQCTASARRVVAEFGGRVLGFYREENPAGEIVCDEEGHDFAFVADRFVVDFWAVYAASVSDRAILDLTDADDRSTALRLYGPQDAWKFVSEYKPVRSQ